MDALTILTTLSDPNAPVTKCQPQCLGHELFAPSPLQAGAGIAFVLIVLGVTAVLRWQQ